MRHEIKDIKCNVNSCIYHEGTHKCTAGSIEVGPSSACSCSETLCATFEPNSNMTNNK